MLIDDKNRAEPPSGSPESPRYTGSTGRGRMFGAIVHWLQQYRWIALFGIFAIIFVAGIAFQRAGYVGLVITNYLTNASLPANYLRGAFADVERLTFDISFDNYQKLNYKREQAIERGILVTDDDSWVSAQIRYGESVLRCKMRLKGDLPDHLSADQWSFRINLRDDSVLYGMKRFSLHSPVTRNYIHEWIFHQAAHREGLIALRYKFVAVTINGEDRGLYALEESFEKRLLENNQRREAPIIKFDENPWWVESGGYVRDYALPGAGHYFSLPIEMFQTNKTLADSTLAKQFLLARDLLEGFRSGALSASDVFDIQLQAKYFALIDLLGGFHGLNTIQLRYYFNPITAKLEPIPFDGNGGRVTPELSALYKTDEESPWSGDLRQRFTGAMFADTAFYRLYLAELNRMSQPEYLDDFFDSIDEALNTELSKIYSGYPEYRFDMSAYETNRKFIRSFLEPVSGITVYLERGSSDSLILRASQTQRLPLELTAIVFSDGAVLRFDEPVFIAGKALSEPSVFVRVVAPLTDSQRKQTIVSVRYRVLGLAEERGAQLLPWPAADVSALTETFSKRKTNITKFSFLEIDERKKTITVPMGQWKIEGEMLIPSGYQFIVEAGTTLEFVGKNSCIISHSAVEFSGSAENPIIIRATGGIVGSRANGIAVINAGGESRLSHVRFENLSAPQNEFSSFTGAITFYQSPVTLSNCEFINNSSEDALNCVLSPYQLIGCVFRDIHSDAFDGDFSDGTITNCQFINCGNDAIDVSGSTIEINNVTIVSVRDKALSIGEGSIATVHSLKVRNSEIGIASKDNSSVQITDLELDSCHLGFTVYQKKTEFGPATITVSGLDTSMVNLLFLVEARSELIIDGVAARSDQVRVKDQLYGIKYGTSSN